VRLFLGKPFLSGRDSLHLRAPVREFIGGQNAKVVFAGDAPGFVGLSQINVIVPPTVTPGPSVPVSVVAAGNPSAQMVVVAITVGRRHALPPAVRGTISQCDSSLFRASWSPPFCQMRVRGRE
jgi:hypothetical protein